MRPIFIKYGIIAVCLLVVAISGLYFLFTPPKGYIYYFPENYAGWICIQHGDNSATPLPEQDGYLIIKVPINGILKTSSQLRTSPTRDKYYYYNGTQIKEAKGLEFGGGGTLQGVRTVQGVPVPVGPITAYFWISKDSKRDYDLYVKGKNIDLKNIPCGPFK